MASSSGSKPPLWSEVKSFIFKETSGAKKDMTMVVLGETGVGKSTWINSFCNYVQLTSFEDALSETKKFYVPIYTKFKYILPKNIQDDDVDDDDEFQDVDIEYGRTESSEEKFASTVRSSTKAPCSYQMTTHGKASITLVDTQGIADNTYTGERAKEEDNKNINYILEHLSTFDRINAFVILLKPEEKRLNDGFRYCMRRLFSELHTSALQNVVFAFTHAKSTDFTLAESVHVLKELFEEINVDFKITSKNMFFFDNSPFRYLAVRAKGYQPKESRSTMRDCWKKSSEQCLKLLKYVRKLEPHETWNTYSIHEARMSVQLMTEPLMEICKDIKEAQRKLFAEREKVEKDIKKEGKQTVYVPATQITMKYTELKAPQTVCYMCCEEKSVEQSDGTKIRKKVYNPICCKDCWLPFVTLESKGSWNLIFCSVFPIFSDKCKVCQHPRKEHVHIKYCLEHVSKDIQLTLEEMQKTCETLESEYNFIVDAMGKFIFYQRENSIATFNDSVTSQLDDEINRISHNRGNNGGALEDADEEKLKILVELRSSYIENYKELIDEATPSPTPEDIAKLREQIFTLEIKGEQLKTIYQKIKEALKIHGQQNCRVLKKFDLNMKDGGFPKIRIKTE